MTAPRWQPILEQIRSLAARPDTPVSDAELLSRFVARHDETAFEALLRRHGPMVLRVARRVLKNQSDAEDVFQATFLLLARRAGAIRKRESVASWLHGVAHRLALSARGKRARRQECERHAAARAVESPPESAWSELEETLHEVLTQLPAKYRTPLVYCYLEGRTQEEAARDLAVPLGTLRSWLARGRELLRKRLVRRGVSLSVEGASAALLASACATTEAVPPSLRLATVKAAHLFATGGNAMTLISPAVAALVRKGLTTMLVAKLKGGAVCMLALALLIVGTGWAAHRTFRAKPPEANETAEKASPKQAASEERPRTDAFGDPLPPGAIARLGTIRFRREKGQGWQFAISSDGRTLAIAAGRSLTLHDLATGRLLCRFPFPQIIHCVAFAPDGKSVAVGGGDGIARRIDVVSGKELQRFAGHQGPFDPFFQGVWVVGFLPDGRKLITQGSDRTVRVWQTHSGKELRQLDIKTQGADSICISPNGKLVAVWAQESQRTLRLWDIEAGKEVRQWTFPDVVGSAAFSPDNEILAVGYGSFQGPGGRIVLWELESGKEIRASPRGDTGTVTALAFAPDGKTLASAGFGWSMRFWDVGSMKELRATPLLPPLHTVHQLAFSTDGKMLFSGGGENHVRLWDVASGKERIPAAGPSEAIHGLAYSPNAKLVAAASANKIWLWSATTGKLVRALVGPGLSSVSDAAFSADGKLLLALLQDNRNEWDGTIQLWDVETGKERRRIQTIQTMRDRIKGIALAPDGRTVAAWGPFTGDVVHLWRLDAATKPRAFVVPSADPLLQFVGSPRLTILRFSPDDKVLYAVSGLHFAILRWDLATGKSLPPIGQVGGTADKIALSPDGRSLAALLSGALYLYEIASNQTRLVQKTAFYGSSVAFSPNGNLLALAYSGDPYCRENAVEAIDKEQVHLVRVADGKVIHRFTGHRGGINCVSFSPDGRTLASGGQDTTVLLWDVTKVRKDAMKEAPHLTPEKLGELWKGLRGTAAESHGCMSSLISAPGQAVPFLGAKLKPVVALDAERFDRLLKKLDSDQFAPREEATQELKKMGDAIEPALRKAIQDKPTLEIRRRLQALLDDLDGSERLRSLRAIEILERIGDKPARDLLRRLSDGASGTWLTEEARVSLRRLERRNK